MRLKNITSRQKNIANIKKIYLKVIITRSGPQSYLNSPTKGEYIRRKH